MFRRLMDRFRPRRPDPPPAPPREMRPATVIEVAEFIRAYGGTVKLDLTPPRWEPPATTRPIPDPAPVVCRVAWGDRYDVARWFLDHPPAHPSGRDKARFKGLEVRPSGVWPSEGEPSLAELTLNYRAADGADA